MATRILQVNAFFAKVGGAEVYMHLLAEALAERGYEVGLFGGSPELEWNEPATRVVRRPDFDATRLIRDSELSRAFDEFCDRFRPDLIHVHNIYHFAADFVRTLGARGVPVVQTVHEWGQLCPNAWCVRPDGTVCEGGPGTKCMQHGCEANYPYDGRVLTASILRYHLVPATFHHFLCPSQALADDLARHGYPDVEGLPLWVDVEGFTSGAASAPVEHDPERILFMGRLVREKGVEYLVRAMPHVLKEVPGAKLSIVGGGDEEPSLRALAAELRLEGSVTFHGKVPHEEVRDFFATAAVNVLPSIWCENSPVTCYESYIAGTPMVASRIAGLPAMVVEGETGLLAEPRNPEDLARQIVRILADRELRARLAEGCRNALGRFSKERHLERVVEVYTSLLEGELPARTPSPFASDDLIDVLQRTIAEYSKLEAWAGDMKRHIDWLESERRPTVIERIGRKLGR